MKMTLHCIWRTQSTPRPPLEIADEKLHRTASRIATEDMATSDETAAERRIDEACLPFGTKAWRLEGGDIAAPHHQKAGDRPESAAGQQYVVDRLLRRNTKSQLAQHTISAKSAATSPQIQHHADRKRRGNTQVISDLELRAYSTGRERADPTSSTASTSEAPWHGGASPPASRSSPSALEAFLQPA